MYDRSSKAEALEGRTRDKHRNSVHITKHLGAGERGGELRLFQLSLPKAAGTEQTLDRVYWPFGFYSSLTFQQIFNSQSIWVCVIAYLIVPITWLDGNQDRDKLGRPRVLSKPPRVLESEIVVSWKCAVP